MYTITDSSQGPRALKEVLNTGFCQLSPGLLSVNNKLPGKNIQCASCTKTMRCDNLKRHIRSCKSNNPKQGLLLEKQLFEEKENNIPKFIENNLYSKKPKTHDDEKQRTISHFNGEEYSGNKPQTRETMEKIMHLVGVPQRRRNKIAEQILQEEGKLLLSTRDWKNCSQGKQSSPECD